MRRVNCLEKLTADAIRKKHKVRGIMLELELSFFVFFPQVSVYTDTIISDSKIMISVQEIEINLQCTLTVENGNNF